MAFGALLSPFGLVVASVVAITASLAAVTGPSVEPDSWGGSAGWGEIPFVAGDSSAVETWAGIPRGRILRAVAESGKSLQERSNGVRAANFGRR